MNVSVILAHPAAGSLNHAIADTVVERLRSNGHDVFFHDLYRERFDPILVSAEIPRDAELPDAIAQHCAELARADGIVVVHPNWWGQPPAILTGWVDRVIRPGVAYEFLEGDSGEGVPKGLLKVPSRRGPQYPPTRRPSARSAFSATRWRRSGRIVSSTSAAFPRFHRRTFSIVVTSSDAERREWAGGGGRPC